MKKKIFGALIIMFITAGMAYATIVGSDHDLSTTTGNSNPPSGDTDGYWIATATKWDGSEGIDEVCIFCHTPHHGIARDQPGWQLPLWNRRYAGEVNIETTVPNFTLYDSTTFDAKTGFNRSQPSGMSLLCLSCHDGITSLYQIISHTQYSSITNNGGGANAFGDISCPGGPCANNIGGGSAKDLSNDHPVSFDFTADLIIADTNTRGALGLQLPADARVKLFNNRLECATCHDPHEEGTIAAGTFPYLRRDNIGSQLCLTCHIK